MKLAFFHDTPLLYDDKKKYYSIGFPYKLWEDRYLKVFDEMIVSTRSRSADTLSDEMFRGYTESGGEHVEIMPVSSYDKLPDMILKRKKINREIDRVLDKVDVAIIRLPSIIGIMAARRCIKKGKPWGTEVVTCVKDAYNGQGWKGKLLAPYFFKLNRKYISKADAALYVTQNFLQERYPSHAPSIGVANVMIDEPADEVLERRLKKIENHQTPVVFGIIGSLNVGFKGHDTAIKALARIKDKIPQFELQLLGGGNKEKWRKFAENYGIAENVKFCGTLPSGQPVLEWLDGVDILLIPSLQEGLPRALVEAMSRGCPALGSCAGGIPELIREEFIHDMGDYVKLSSDICRLVGDKELMKKTAVENFTKSKIYSTSSLDPKRLKFWRSFRESIEKTEKNN